MYKPKHAWNTTTTVCSYVGARVIQRMFDCDLHEIIMIATLYPGTGFLCFLCESTYHHVQYVEDRNMEILMD